MADHDTTEAFVKRAARADGLPPVESLPFEDARDALAKLLDLGERTRTMQAAAYELEEDAKRAPDVDQAAHADAIRNGKPAPKPTVDAARSAAEKARAVAAAHEHAFRDEAASFLTFVEANRAAWAVQLDADVIAPAKQRAREALEAFASALSDLADAQGLLSWLADPARSKRGAGWQARQLVTLPRADDAPRLGPVLDALRLVVDPPHVEPVRPTYIAPEQWENAHAIEPDRGELRGGDLAGHTGLR